MSAGKRYKIDLQAQTACCEGNYARLMRLMPDIDEQDSWQYHMPLGEKTLELQLLITERAPYTTMLDVQQKGDGFSKLWSLPGRLQVRLYHDVKMAEVVALNQHNRLQSRYDYPNDKMYQQDEKVRLNQHLTECLIYVAKHGRMPVGIDLL